MAAPPGNSSAFFRPLIDAVLRAAEPGRALAAQLDQFSFSGPLYLLAFGKASVPMAAEFLRRHNIAAGVVIAPANVGLLAPFPPLMRVFSADHPLPTARNLAAAAAAADLARSASAAGSNATLVALISGGGSAHLTLPAPGLTLDELALVTHALLRAGAPIHDLNTVRKHCEQLKGGRLTALGHPARVHAYILSDVLGDRLDMIASGPTAPDPTTYAVALAALDRYSARDVAPAVTRHLEAGTGGQIPETLKPADPVFAAVTNTIIASNRTAVDAAVAWARHAGLQIASIDRDIQGSAADVGTSLARRTAQRSGPTPACWIAGSETTVPVGAATGKGGRCQEAALAAAIALDGTPNAAFLAFATDGIDGPTDAAGAIVTGQICQQARGLGLDPAVALKNHDSHAILNRLGTLIRTGPTGTNVNDIAIAVRF